MELVCYPDPGLQRAAAPVTRIDDEIREAIPRMFEIMYEAHGVGLAGPQAGLARRVAVANLTGDPARKDEERVLINPEILESSGEIREEEGCLSVPGMFIAIARAERVVARYRDLEWREVRRSAEGMEAKMFQHETDHLNGILIVEKMSPADRKQWAPLLKDLEDEFEEASRASARPRRSRSKAER